MSRTSQVFARLRVGASMVLGIVLVLTAGCGLSANDEPEPLSGAELPAELRPQGTDATGPVFPLPETEPNTEQLTVWFLRADESGARYLEPVSRMVPTPGNADQRLEALIQQPPNELERVDGITSLVPSDARLMGRPEVSDSGVLEVNFSESFYDLQGDSSRYAFAQVVYTVTEMEDVEAVRFLNEGREFEVVDGDGESRSGPVDRDAYRNLERGE